MENFIENLQKKRSAYNFADQVRTQARSLQQLSNGIYTEEERFFYELLQNAVDSFIDTYNEKLDIKVEIKGNMLCFLHNGSPFSQRDVEGLCDVGYSNKASNDLQSNKKKVGYKGIGFKSVFMPSVDYVCVKTKDYCFKFDKKECLEIIPKFENEVLSDEEIPWQIIPIECECPSGFDIKGYNVATFIRTNINETLTKKLKNLLKDPQFLLFLNVDNINISLILDDEVVLTAGRTVSSEDGEVHLLNNGTVISRWLVHTTAPLSISHDIRKTLKKDFNTPQKLREATDFVISFAISINTKKEIEAIKDSVVFTFLPTSYKNLGVNFLINANFLTDAGRQQLVQNSEWNRMIFAQIPRCFLQWIAELSPEHKDFYKILPGKSPKSKDELTNIFSKNLEEAISEIAFIPRVSDDVVIKASDAIIDCIDFSKAIGKVALTNYINKLSNHTYKQNAYIRKNSISLMKEYGVFVFDKNALLKYISNDENLVIHNVDDDKQFITYLYGYCHDKDNDSIEIMQALSELKFIYDNKDELNKASNLFFPPEQDDFIEYADKFAFVCKDLLTNLSHDITQWLGEGGLGISDFTQKTLVDHTLNHPEIVTVKNAIELGTLLFNEWQKENYLLDEQYATKMKSLPFLSKKGDLVPIGNLYLGSKYSPEDDIESLCSKIEYISEDYVEDNSWDDWSIFFKKCGIGFKIEISCRVIDSWSEVWKDYAKKYPFLSEAKESMKVREHDFSGHCGCQNPIEKITFKLYYFSFVNQEKPNEKLDKMVFSKILATKYDDSEKDKVCGRVHYWYDNQPHRKTNKYYHKPIVDNLIEHTPVSFSSKYQTFLEYIVSNEQKFPTHTGESLPAKEVYLNTPTILKYGQGYLPILDIDSTVDDSWLSILPFKKELQLADYLSILEAMSNNPSDDGKERVNAIYNRLIELGFEKSDSIRMWGQTHRLLERSGKKFIPAKELSYITVEGFKNMHQIYVGKIDESQREAMLTLLETFGVKVITNEHIRPRFENVRESNGLRNALLQKLDYIALLSEGINDLVAFEKKKSVLENRIQESSFYQCDKIALTYGNSEDEIVKKAFAQGDKFYYVGSLTPTRIEPLITSIVKLLNLKGVDRELLIILITNEREEIIDYLQSGGFATNLLPNTDVQNNEYAPDINVLSHDTISPQLPVANEDNPKSEQDISPKSSKEREKYIEEYSKRLKTFMGSNFSMPNDEKKAIHIIARLRILMYLKNQGYKFKNDFDERSYLKKESFLPIPLSDGKLVYPQSTLSGIWYLSPNVWYAIVNKGDLACLCNGYGENDFIIIKDDEDIKELAEKPASLFIRLAATDKIDIMQTIHSLFDTEEKSTFLNFNVEYISRDVHLLLLSGKPKNQIIESMYYGKDFSSEGGNFDF